MTASKSILPLLVLPLALSAAAGTAGAQCDALLFDGIDDLATVPDLNDDFDLGTAMTVEVWARVDVSHAGSGFAGGRTIGAGGTSWMLGQRLSVPADAALVISTPLTSSVYAPGGILLGEWRHYAGTFDGFIMKIYIDGQLVATDSHANPGTIALSAMLILGVTPNVGSTDHFEGALDELRIWNTVRTDSEIAADYLLPLTGSEPGLVGYYKFDEGVGDVILDSSVHGNDGFLGATAGADVDDPVRVPTSVPFSPCVSSGLCFGDGSGTPCPCGNTGGAGEGCENSSGAGALQSEGGGRSVSQDNLLFSTANLLTNQPALLFAGENAINSGDGILFGDGLRCAGANVVRLGVRVPDGAGDAGWGPGLGATGGWSAGDTRYFQTWYRDPSGSPCGNGFNLSNANEVVFLP